MASGKWTILTPILVTLIPVTTGIITTIMNAPSPNKADVTIETSVADEFSQTGHMDIKNVGGAPATNMTVFVESESVIENAIQSSFVNITTPELNDSAMPRKTPKPIDNTTLQFRIPHLIQGDGGIINVNLTFDKNQTREDFDVAAIYDQGSAVGKELGPFQLSSEIFYLIVFFLVIPLVGEIIFILYMLLIYRRKVFTKSLHKNLFNIRRKLVTDLSYDESFTLDWEMKLKRNIFELFKPKDKFARTIYFTQKFIKNISDLIKVDDVLDLISRRERKLNSNEIYDLNDQLLTSIEDLLENIDWTKYK